MLNLYSPTTGANIATAGAQGASPDILALNILIELRVANMLQIELAKGNFNVTLEELRTAVVTETVNPSM